MAIHRPGKKPSRRQSGSLLTWKYLKPDFVNLCIFIVAKSEVVLERWWSSGQGLAFTSNPDSVW